MLAVVGQDQAGQALHPARGCASVEFISSCRCSLHQISTRSCPSSPGSIIHEPPQASRSVRRQPQQSSAASAQALCRPHKLPHARQRRCTRATSASPYSAGIDPAEAGAFARIVAAGAGVRTHPQPVWPGE
ncbi:hypothetical protein BN2497_6225 [Janthinobacterium sp. CG23_2]|nr:hypothetical protein BN2497_6225 [Janthinobacterium sp. CG23_2]CUU29510.1 hypothetical protein BN3177_6225 [Janthinobacterium sp. CG23_2]